MCYFLCLEASDVWQNDKKKKNQTTLCGTQISNNLETLKGCSSVPRPETSFPITKASSPQGMNQSLS